MASSGDGNTMVKIRCATLKISIDPNCRPSMTKDPIAYREGIARFFHLADLIKCKRDEDLEYLHPEWTDRALEKFIETYSPQLCIH